MSKLITPDEVTSFFASGAARIYDMTAVERHAFSEALGKAGPLITAGYRDVSEYMRHVERDMRSGAREIPPSLRGSIAVDGQAGR